ncbi:MAG: hypothetical protein ACRDZ3_14035 [Acidimicrobiia bacterium]
MFEAHSVSRPRRLALAAALSLAAASPALQAGAPLARADDGPTATYAVTAPPGYWLVGQDGGVFSYGGARFFGSTGDVRLNQPIVGLTPTNTGEGYWMVASDGGVFSFGDARFFGSTGAVKLNKPIVGMASTVTGDGYWMVASDGGIFSFGDARFFGSTGDVKLNKPIVGMAPTASGQGYWLVASDGGLFSFGDAAFYGSGQSSGKAIVGMTATRTGRGYWQAAATGEVLAFGDAADYGSGRVNAPVVGISRTASGGGYWMVASDGGIFSFGDAAFHGSTGGVKLNQPIVGLAVPSPGRSDPGPTGPGPTTPGSTNPGTTPTTTGPGGPDPDDDPPTYEYEQISPPMESPNGGTNTADIPTSGTNCGFPSAPERNDLPADIDYVGEASGLVASDRYPGWYWMIRDGANNPRRDEMYAVKINSNGDVTSRPVPIPGAFNGDWEEINYSIGSDGRARLWITESGQNTSMGVFDDIYEVLEPDPATAETAELLNTYEYQYPDRAYNTESAFIHNGLLVMVAKVTPHARVYRFDSLTPVAAGADPRDHNPRFKNVPTYIGEFGNSKDVSVVRQSPNGKMLITSSHQVVHMYRSTDGSGSLKSFLGRLPDCELKAFPDGNVEAGEFESNTVMVFLDELKKSFRLTIAP